MDVTGAGTAVMIAIAAALWFAYFLPTWMRRREYLDTERTATRLQQTLRVMAETAELPDQVRVEVSTRDAARAERVLRAEQRRADVLAARTVASVRAATPGPLSEAPLSQAQARRRRAHRLASLLMVTATVTIAAQLWLMVAGSSGAGAWLVFAAGSALGVAGLAVRRRLDVRSARPSVVAAARVTVVADHAEAKPAPRSWTPVAVPAPLYLSRPAAQPVKPAMDLATQLRAAALESERAIRAAHESPEVIPIRRQRPAAPERATLPVESPAMRPAHATRWAAMGRVSGMDASAPDLDEVLRRRRNAG